MFGTRRVLEEISETLQRMDETLRGMDARMGGEFKLTRDSLGASIENNTRVTREVLLELRDHRPILDHIDHGVQANTDGLMHVLNELRNGRGGPGAAPAA